MINIDANEEYKKYFGKAMPQIIHDIRNPLNIIIGFSSIMQIDDSISQENAEYLQKINQSAIQIEEMLSNIDYFDLDLDDMEYDTVNISDIISEVSETTIASIFQNVEIKHGQIDSIEIYIAVEVIKKIFKCLFGFSYKGFKTTTTNKQVYLSAIKKDNYFYILYSDTTNCVTLNNKYFTFEESINARRGMYPIFLQKYVELLKGKISYCQQKQWHDICTDYTVKTDHGFIIEIPLG